MATRAKGTFAVGTGGVVWPGSELRLRTPPRRRRTGRRQPEVLEDRLTTLRLLMNTCDRRTGQSATRCSIKVELAPPSANVPTAQISQMPAWSAAQS